MDAGTMGSQVSWSTWRDVPRVIAFPRHLKRTAITALVVGSVFFAMNQLGAILAGNATATVWWKGALTFVTPLFVSNIGILSATRRR